MFAFVSAFPKSLHCTDEAQQAETVLSAVLSIYICIYIVYINIYMKGFEVQANLYSTDRRTNFEQDMINQRHFAQSSSGFTLGSDEHKPTPRLLNHSKTRSTLTSITILALYSRQNSDQNNDNLALQETGSTTNAARQLHATLILTLG